MEMIADALLIAGAGGAAMYCRVLSSRLRALKDMDSGVGAAIAQLSRQVDDMRLSLDAAKSVSGDQSSALNQLTARAEMAAGRLELLLAALHENGKARALNVRRPARAAAAATAVKSPVAAALAAFEDEDSVVKPASTPDPRPDAAASQDETTPDIAPDTAPDTGAEAAPGAAPEPAIARALALAAAAEAPRATHWAAAP
jgi:hypothetical protein